ncbi:MAG: selenoprotein B, partial [Actinomycetota bacterium]|nr:selenoprotein B [Actinomycetota bacterium]
MLAHVMEEAGLATIVLASMRPVVEKMKPPRSLYCEFPLGRPLGVPNDPEFQHRVLADAFALLDAPNGPVIADFP